MADRLQANTFLSLTHTHEDEEALTQGNTDGLTGCPKTFLPSLSSHASALSISLTTIAKNFLCMSSRRRRRRVTTTTTTTTTRD